MSTLYLTVSEQGGIWSGKPNAQTNPNPLHKEAATNESLFQIATSSSLGSSYKAIVVSANGGIWLSNRIGTQPGTWTKVYDNPSYELYSAAYGDGVWIVAGLNGVVLRSTDATNWTEVKGAVPGGRWNQGSFGNGKFVFVGARYVGQDYLSAVMYSDDLGLTWKKGNPGTKGALLAIDYSPQLNMFVAVGNGGAIVSVAG